jgi:hypothetical protein
MQIKMAAVAACALTLGGSPASANIITVAYTGVSSGQYNEPFPSFQLRFFSNAATTETYVFDTTKGTLTFDGFGGFTLIGGNVSNRLEVDGIWSSFLPGSSNSLVVNGQTVTTPLTTGGFTPFEYVSAGAGPFPWQTGTCPGGPCGLFTVSTTTITGDLPTSPVPAPLVGGGLPGFLGLSWWLWKRRRQVNVQVKLRPRAVVDPLDPSPAFSAGCR